MPSPLITFLATLFFALLLHTGSAYAAFPMHAENPPVSSATLKHKSIALSHYIKPLLPEKANGKSEREWMSIASVAMGVAGLMVFTFYSPAVVLIGCVFALGALIMGSMGTNDKYSGLAYAGLILGTAELAVAAVVGFIVYFFDIVSLFG